jgi:hypothetical protein
MILAMALPASPAADDVFYIEMPGVTGPLAMLLTGSGDAIGGAPIPTQLCGLQVGAIWASRSSAVFCNMEVTGNVQASQSYIRIQDTITDTGAAGFDARNRGPSIRCSLWSQTGGEFSGVSATTVSTASAGWLWNQVGGMLWERSASASTIQLIGSNVTGGNNILNTLGTNSSTAHGAACQVFGTSAPGPGFLQCGAFLAGSFYGQRIKFSNMGANPAVRVVGPGIGCCIEGFSGGVADGNTDVGVDFGPNGLFGNVLGAMGCNVAVVGTPTVTGSAGDVRSSAGQIFSWTQLLATGVTDIGGNRFVPQATGPLAVVGKFSGLLMLAEGTSVFSYLADPGIGEAIIPTTNQVNPSRYPTSFRLINRLRGCAPLGTPAGGAVTFTLYKNAVATAVTCTIPASSGAGTKAVDAGHTVIFLDGDDYDVRVDAGTIPSNIPLSATIEGPC